ncbi:Dynein light chain, partial [Giardia duodenalis]
VNDPAGVSIDSLCRPSSSPQAIAAGCTGEASAGVCKACSGGFFLFMGGCYKAGVAPGSEICTKAEGGKCTACKTDGSYIFQNRAATVTLGNECILCSDATGVDGVTGVENCHTCQAPNSAGPAACNTCQEGYYKNGDACQKCDTSCATCGRAGTTSCETCKAGYYLKGDKSCSNTCDGSQYADKQSGECKACSEITGCTACAYNDATGKPKCTACNGGKKVKTALDGTTTCVDVASNCVDSDHFKDDGTSTCLQCGDVSKGVEHCATCTAAKVCTGCLPGFFKTSATSCTACGANCATCTSAAINDCTACLPGYFLKTDGSNKECVLCDNVDKGGIDGCVECTNAGTFKCTKCKPNRKSKGDSGNYTCEEKTCEDETACGGTAGACGAIVIGASGEMTYYCSLCGQSNYVPIDGKCVDSGSANGNTCTNGACQSCAANYFLYMGGCYSVSKEPGNLMCTAAAGGICTTAANNKYFAVPGASNQNQSVLGCGNPFGTNTTESNAYVGLEGCRTCEAPTAATGMAAAKCTACDEGKALTGSGYGCVTCSIPGCTTCRADNMCEACGDGHRLEGETCVRTSTIAGMSVTKSLSALRC